MTIQLIRADETPQQRFQRLLNGPIPNGWNSDTWFHFLMKLYDDGVLGANLDPVIDKCTSHGNGD